MTPEEKDQRIAELEAEVCACDAINYRSIAEIERLRTALFDARAVLEAPPLSEMQFNGSTEMVKHICKKVDEAKRILAEVTDDTVLSSTPTAPTEECGACKGTGFTRTEYSNGTPNNTVYGGCDSCNATGRVGAPASQPDPKDATIERLRTALEAARTLVRRCGDWQCDHDGHVNCAFGLIAAALSGAPVAPTPSMSTRDARQLAIHGWCAAAFGADHAASVPQRGVRLLEEAIEAYQAAGCERDMAHRLVDHVFALPVGDLAQEIGGVGVTLLALSQAAGISADTSEYAEFARVLAKPLEHFKARNEAKNAAGFNVGAPVAPTEERNIQLWGCAGNAAPDGPRPSGLRASPPTNPDDGVAAPVAPALLSPRGNYCSICNVHDQHCQHIPGTSAAERVAAPVTPCPDCDTGFPEGRLCLTCNGTCVVAPAPGPPAPTTCKGCNGTRKRSINHRYNKAGECVEYDEVSCPLCCGPAPTNEKL